jgi:murein DD-endopeptidase MepM/ murein hydrolase activator NlpD
MDNIVLSSIAKDFESIRSNIEKIVKIKGQEKISKNLEDNRVKQQAYKSRYQKQPTRIKSPGLKNTASSLMSGLGDMLKALLAIIGIAGLFSILKSTGIGKHILTFVKNAFSAIIDLIQKGFSFIRDVLFDSDVQSSLRKLATTFFSFIGTLIVASVSLGVSLLRDNEVLETLKNTVVAVFKAVVEGIKAAYGVISQLVIENMDMIKQTALDVFSEITNALILSLKSIQSILAGGLDPRITEGLKEIFIASWEFIKDLFTTEFKDVETGKSFTLAEKGAIWLAKLVGLGALWLVLKGKLIMMGKSLSGVNFAQNCGSCMDLDLPDRRKPPQGKPNVPEGNKNWLEKQLEKGKEGFKKVGEKVSQYTGQAIDAVKSAAKRAWGTVTEFGARLYDKAASLGNKVYDYVSRGVKKFANVFRAILKSPAIRDKALQKFGQKIGIEAMKRIGVKLAAAVAGLATGGVVTAIMGVLLAIDIAMLFYAFYEFMFVTTDGETEDGGFYPQIKSEVDKWLKDNPETTPTPAPPPPPAPAPAPAPAPTTKAAAGNTSTTSAKPAQVSTQTKPTPASAPAPAPTKTSAMNMPVPASLTAPTAAVTLDPGESMVVGNGEFKPYPGGNNSLPVKNAKLTSIYGGRINPVTGQYQDKHNGVDLAVPSGTPILAVNSGTVSYAGQPNNISGNTVRVKHDDGTSSGYAHLSAFNVKAGDKVVRGQQIALSGGERGAPGAGASTGPHLHLVMYDKNGKDVDPKTVIPELASIKAGTMVARAKDDMILASASRSQTMPEVQNIPQKPADAIDNASGMVRSGLRTLEDLFLTGRPSFTDMSTVVNQNNTISRPGGNLKLKEEKAFEFLIERQVS